MVPVAGSGSGAPLTRFRITITGTVQGVGFRPFVYRLATEMGLTGWVRNTPAGVLIQVQGTTERLAHFNRRLRDEHPPLALIASLEKTVIPDEPQEEEFSILPSADGAHTADIPPDTALCPDCLAELFDPADRRYRYPFITCTNCGPRWTIITGIPYDRPLTTMAPFPLCDACRAEYHNPHDRRFHAQPLACPVCGPEVRLLDAGGNPLSPPGDSAIRHAVHLLQQGDIVAVKGLGGYHLAVDACNDAAVGRLRQRKKRDEKPFAIMVPDLETARSIAFMDQTEERLLAGGETPVVIVRKRPGIPVAGQVSPQNGWLGIMLPSTPLHHLLFAPEEASSRSLVPGLRFPLFTALVMTSANRSDEPVAYLDAEALEQLDGIADAFLTNNREIHTRTDDSVMRVFQGRPLFYRRSRGYVPRAIQLPMDAGNLLATGAELKNTICLTRGNQAYLSQHIGDLKNSSTYDGFRHAIEHLSRLLEVKPAAIACDLHPDYLSSIHAAESGLPVIHVQHHHAHLAACMAENSLVGEVIGIIFDGTGLGTDGTVWGGEFLVGGYEGFRREGHFRPVRMPGGDAAVREPWRMACAYLYQALGAAAFELAHPAMNRLVAGERDMFRAMLERGINSPPTSSCGRLFDAVAALLDIRHHVSYDGQAAMELEALAETAADGGGYPYACGAELDFAPMISAILADRASGVATPVIARRFHAGLAMAAMETCDRIAAASGLDRVVLSGGVFQNRLLSELLYTGLTGRGFQVFTHRLSPPNDGSIALGQAAIAGWQTRRAY